MGHCFVYNEIRKTKEVFPMTRKFDEKDARYRRLMVEKKRLKEEKDALVAFSLLLMSAVGILLILI